ncbi:DegT/DnrJ/EryC1/StrS family aminotransferase [Polynucleobacter paneuropaeus]|nr:DegT/DnrJ/EryC1/StrS family aminotransferase [Polynucleobacter paneuropaeus]
MPGYEVMGNEEFREVQDVFAHGGVLFRHGFDAIRNDCFKVRDFEKAFAKAMGVKYALAVTSGTAALRVGLAALGIKTGDEVVTQCFTFVATVEAIIESGATPVCTQVDLSLNMDPDDLISKITSKTKAVIVVHMLGVPAKLEQISKICSNRNIVLIEDTAWGCGGNLEGTALGAWGDIGTYSFDFAKTMTTGEGGMVLFKSEELYKKAFAWHDHGHENNPLVPRWEDTRSSSGFNYRMMELQGAIGLAQLKKLPSIVIEQRKNRDALWCAINDLPNIELRPMPNGSYDTADALVFLVKDNNIARRCRDELLKVGLSTKILPEAYTWHFAGTWKHMPELVDAHGGDLSVAFASSAEILRRAVSIPVGVRLNDDAPIKLRTAIIKAISP